MHPSLCRWLLLALLLGGTGGCATSFLYDRADRLANRWVSGYVDLEADQQAVLDERLADLHDWHRREQLPRYAAWLRALASRLEGESTMEEDEVRALGRDLLAFWRELGAAAVPMLTDVGAGLEDAQVATLLETLYEERQDEIRSFERRSAHWHEERRARSMARFLRRWTGPLANAQRASVEAWAASLEPTREAYFANRAGWIDDLEEALQRRNDPGALRAAAENLFVDPSRRWSPDYAERTARNAARTTVFFTQFLNQLEDRQRARAIGRLTVLAEEFEELALAGR